MSFKLIYKTAIASLLTLLVACSDEKNERHLVDVHTVANQDLIAINFELNTSEIVLSINSNFEFILKGLKSNGRDVVTVLNDVRWTLSAGASSKIDQRGNFTAGSVAEFITLTAQLGFLTASIDIKVSSAKFDQVVQLSEQSFDIDLCRSHAFEPIGRYIDENNNEEIRPVDSSIIDTIEWIILNQEDNSASQRAYIEITNNKSVLNALAAGDIIIQARAISLVSDTVVTSAEFIQPVSSMLNSIKLCRSSDTDLNSCNLTSASFEKDQVLTLSAVGNYQALDGSNFNENITKNSKWGISNIMNATGAFSNATTRQQYQITGETEASVANVSVACGDIDQSIVSEDITQGVSLDSEVSCSGINCFNASATLNIANLSVESFEVSANDIDLSDDVSVTLDQRPDTITLIVTANFSNNTSQVVTSDSSVTYSIIDIDSISVIEKESGSPGVFTVLVGGTAKIQIDYRGEKFVAVILVP